VAHQILSDQLRRKPLELHEAETQSFGGWDMQICPDTIVLSIKHQLQVASYALRGLQNFSPTEQTLAMREIGLPTALARVDFTIDSEDNVYPYEVEERPSGLGVTRMINDQVGGDFGQSIRGHLENTFGQMPIVKRLPEHRSDDEYLFGENNVYVLERESGLLVVENRPTLVRAEPELVQDAPNIAELQSQSISTVLDKGRKDYRIATGHARVIHGADELPSKDESFVIKNMQSSKTNGVKIWATPDERKNYGLGKSNSGVATWSNIQRFAEENGQVMIERLEPGIRTLYNNHMGTTALRVVVKIFPDHTEVSDGCYMFRESFNLHGARDTITGVVLSPEKAAIYE